ncbi:DUF2935 domain-containing protein [Bariatricus sp. HCP28S3_E4]|uniref:DUF2935 domain-containing protein n=1 Tax=Lachnospiraceae TaxID=186803 RepID=UPI003D001FF4
MIAVFRNRCQVKYFGSKLKKNNPLLIEHILREANHYLRILDMKEQRKECDCK